MHRGPVSGRAAIALVAAAALLALPSAAAGAPSAVKPRIVTADVATLLASGVLTVEVTVPGPRAVTLRPLVTAGGNPEVPLTNRVQARFATAGRHTLAIPLSADGRQSVDTCANPVVRLLAIVDGRSVSDVRTLSSARKDCYLVGLASRSINPSPDGSFAGQPVHLGGYGIGANPVTGDRRATGILGVGPSVRAISISDGRRPLAIADIEVQGWFVATKDGPYGLIDMRRAVEQRTGGALKATQVVIQSDHSHSGADPLGVWGGVPLAFRRLMFDRTVDAIVHAFKNARPGRLYYGRADGRDLLSNQFAYDAANQVMDSDVRVLQARDGGHTFATLLNFSAHSTVLGSSNTKISGDWPQEANRMLETRFGGRAMTMVGTLGRTQPADRVCPDPTGKTKDEISLCTLDDYAGRVLNRAQRAVDSAEPLTGTASVDSASYLILDAASNAVILGLNAVGDPIGVPLNRALTPPWLTGNVLGTVTASARIGDVLLSSMPGEAYPQIPLTVRSIVPARGYMTAGLANDQLGYLIAPFTAYPEPIRRTFFNERGDEISPLDNDNYAFNVSPTLGERVICSLLRGAGHVFGHGREYRDAYGPCAAFANDLAFGRGADTTTG